jgi:hypothetical protein
MRPGGGGVPHVAKGVMMDSQHGGQERAASREDVLGRPDPA